MNTKYVKMLNDFGDDHAKGEVYEIDNETADKWVGAGLAEIDNPQDELLGKFSKALEERDAKLIEKLSDAVKVNSQPPSVKVLRDETDKQKCFGDFVKAVAKDDAERLAKVYGSQKATLTESSGSQGGYLVPTDYRNELLSIDGYSPIVRDRANVVPVSVEKIKWPALNQSGSLSGADSNFYGGVKMTWADENDSATETNQTFKEIELVVNRLSAYTQVSNHLLQDSPISVDALVRQQFALAIGQHLDYQFLRGDGVGKPLGALSGSGSISVTRTTSTRFKLADAANMIKRLPASSMANAVWVMSQSVLSELVQLVDAGNNSVYMPNVQPGINFSLFGLPVMITENLPALGTAKDVCLCDFSKYIIAENQDVTISVSEHVAFLTNKQTFKVDMRLDGQPQLDNAITLADGATTISPFVYLT